MWTTPRDFEQLSEHVLACRATHQYRGICITGSITVFVREVVVEARDGGDGMASPCTSPFGTLQEAHFIAVSGGDFV
ncbi:hypothetical protein AK812_SmicGene18997 [Symbiodinium microadriaticum]|uniref:Uncharacterized protein n=1 Tax=Symbiodinium microadriaticum TaxID=2951 RepID=A0A1Q9DTN4_SYMMI|nr:hypothetical protein AK812_SmicGene18997 [Symbiodinium microadriaticum]